MLTAISTRGRSPALKNVIIINTVVIKPAHILTGALLNHGLKILRATNPIARKPI